jgi:hypothetical protein
MIGTDVIISDSADSDFARILPSTNIEIISNPSGPRFEQSNTAWHDIILQKGKVFHSHYHNTLRREYGLTDSPLVLSENFRFGLFIKHLSEQELALKFSLLDLRIRDAPDFIFRDVESVVTPSIPRQLADISSKDAVALLSSESELTPFAAKLYESARGWIGQSQMTANYLLDVFEDQESETETKNLVLRVRISNKSYAEILNLWDDFADKFSRALPTEMQKRIGLVLDEA